MERFEEFKDDIQRIGVTLDAPIQRTSDTSNFYFVRHGLSLYNFASFGVKAEFGENSAEFVAQMKDTALVDNDLHPIGVMQALTNAPKVHCHNFRYVLVSPMQRAMQTCIHMFKDHPMKDQITFLVEPLCREIVHTPNDCPMDVKELVQKYAVGQPLT